MPTDVPVVKTEGPNDGLEFITVLRDCLSSAIILSNERHQITGFNPRAEQLTGLKAHGVIGRGTESLPPTLQAILQEVSSSGQSVSQRQLLLRDAKGGEIIILAAATPMRSADGNPAGSVLILNDVTPVRKWDANMRRLDRLHSVGTLSASMAHEVKNAFVAVRTFVDLLLEKNKDMELAGTVRHEMARIDSLVTQMMKFAGPPKPTMASLHLHFVLNKSLLLIQHLLEDNKIRLTRSLSAGSDLIEGDQDLLEQAFLNLFLNALDAMDANGKLEVSTMLLPPGARVDGLPPLQGPGRSYLKVMVRDSGRGISAENLGRLYEPFFTTKPEGTGLGLAITRRIIQEHHGAIFVESELNKGTTFSFVFPAREG